MRWTCCCENLPSASGADSSRPWSRAPIPAASSAHAFPFTIAAAGPRAMRVAAEHGQTWVTYGPLTSDAPDSGADHGTAARRGSRGWQSR